MPMNNLIEYSDNDLKLSRRLYQLCRNEPHYNLTDSETFKFKSKLITKTNNAGIIDAETIVNSEILCQLKIMQTYYRN